MPLSLWTRNKNRFVDFFIARQNLSKIQKAISMLFQKANLIYFLKRSSPPKPPLENIINSDNQVLTFFILACTSWDLVSRFNNE